MSRYTASASTCNVPYSFCNSHALTDGRTNAQMQKVERKGERRRLRQAAKERERKADEDGYITAGLRGGRGNAKRRRSMLCRYIPTLVRTRVQNRVGEIFLLLLPQTHRYLLLSLFLS